MNIIINQMDRVASDGFVITCHWSVTKTSGEFTASQYGTESFTEEGSFKPFDELTEADVQGWLTTRWGADGMAAKEAALDAQLQDMANPPVVSGLPW
jgi:hypothetical protein